MKQNPEYWNQQYIQKQTNWDLGYASPPIMQYFELIEDKSLKILIPGSGNAWEAERLWKSGFQNVFVMDFSSEALLAFKTRVPDFPIQHILEQDFFEHQEYYDIIIEQTFFSSLPLSLREKYAQQVFKLLRENGKLIGLLFSHQFNFLGPPFGGSKEEYISLFSPYFQLKTLELCYNSIKPRAGRELFIQIIKRT